jgi:outer membrane biosynthesis protein TonB
MEVRIGPTGNVETSLILDSPNEIFAKAAGAAVLSWKFRPFLVGGAPIVVITKLTFYFRPNGSGGVTVIDANQPEPDRVRKSRG